MQDAHEGNETTNLLDAMIAELRQEIATAQDQRKEIGVLLKQTSAEIERLAQKVKDATARVQHVEASPDSFSRAEVKQAYEASQEAQMRQFMMRSQLEQFSYRDSQIERTGELLTRLLKSACAIQDAVSRALDGGQGERSGREAAVAPADSVPAGAALASIEMSHQRVSRQLQDNTAQTLSDLVLRAEVCERLLDLDQEKVREELSQLRLTASAALTSTRRLVQELRPAALDEQGLAQAIRSLAETFGSRESVRLDVHVEGTERRLPGAVELALFRIIQEILSRATGQPGDGQVEISLWFEPERLVATVRDSRDGALDMDAAMTGEAGAPSTDPTSLRTWADLAGVAISMTPGAETGSTIRLTVPC